MTHFRLVRLVFVHRTVPNFSIRGGVKTYPGRAYAYPRSPIRMRNLSTLLGLGMKRIAAFAIYYAKPSLTEVEVGSVVFN